MQALVYSSPSLRCIFLLPSSGLGKLGAVKSVILTEIFSLKGTQESHNKLCAADLAGGEEREGKGAVG